MDQINRVKVEISEEIILKINALNDKAWQVHDTEPNLGLELSSESKILSEKHGYKQGLAYAIRNMGVSNRYLSNLEMALSLSNQAMELFIELGDKSGESQAIVSIGAIYYYMGDYDKGLDYFLRGLQQGEKIDNKESMAYAYNGAGYIYSVQGDNKKGLNFLQTGLKLSRDIHNFSLESSILESIATLYLNDDQIDKAYDTFIECKKLSEQKNDKRNLGYSHFGIGEVLLKQNKLDEATHSFLKSLSTYREFGYKVGEANSLLYLGKLCLLQESEQSEKYLLESLKVAEEIKAKASIYMVHEALAEFYEKKEDFRSFVKHYKLYHKYKSEVYKEEQELKQKYQSIQFDMDKLQKEAEINRLTNVVMKDKNAELERKTLELEKSYESVSVLSKIGRDITSTLDLEIILNTVYESVNQLMDATVFGIGIYNEEEASIEYRLSVEEGKRYKPYKRMMSDKSQLAVWCIENNKEIFINDIEKEFSGYLKDIDLTVLTSAALEDGSLPKNPNSLIYLPLQVKDKVIGLISIQSFEKNKYNQNQLEIVKTLASYTSAALYNAQSFETLQGTLNKLKSTQDQLVQSEKLASLGQLTAGIAHEIKNPLNFVNNFSELSMELIEEAREELKTVKAYRDTPLPDDALNDISDLLNDIEANLKTIHKHGTRADSIVKSMLEHSRSGSGELQPVDLNNLIKEFANLSFHGMRAGKDPINVDIEFDLDESIQEVPLILEDFSRVLINLCNNAFDAMRDKLSLSEGSDYSPKLILRTFKKNQATIIEIKDNALGIPDDIKDKILQPFFTTKKGTEGTGLGLSITNDIIKAHGGVLEVSTAQNEGTCFTIKLSKG